MSKIAPFQFTYPVIRYLKKITEAYEEKLHEIRHETLALPVECNIETYIDGELFTSTSEENRRHFVAYFEQQGCAHFEDSKRVIYRGLDDDVITFKNKEGEVFFAKAEGDEIPSHMRIAVLNIEPFATALNQHLTGVQSTQSYLLNQIQNTKCTYDKERGYVSFHKYHHTFQKRKGNALPRQIFNILWNSRKHLVNGGKSVVTQGSFTTLEDILKRAHLPETRRYDVRDVIDNIRINLRKKGLPIEVKKKEMGYMLIIKEV